MAMKNCPEKQQLQLSASATTALGEGRTRRKLKLGGVLQTLVCIVCVVFWLIVCLIFPAYRHKRHKSYPNCVCTLQRVCVRKVVIPWPPAFVCVKGEETTAPGKQHRTLAHLFGAVWYRLFYACGLFLSRTFLRAVVLGPRFRPAWTNCAARWTTV